MPEHDCHTETPPALAHTPAHVQLVENSSDPIPASATSGLLSQAVPEDWSPQRAPATAQKMRTEWLGPSPAPVTCAPACPSPRAPARLSPCPPEQSATGLPVSILRSCPRGARRSSVRTPAREEAWGKQMVPRAWALGAGAKRQPGAARGPACGPPSPRQSRRGPQSLFLKTHVASASLQGLFFPTGGGQGSQESSLGW